MKDASIWRPWSANCYWKRVGEGRWLFYSYQTPVGYADSEKILVSARWYSHATSCQITRYMMASLIRNRWESLPADFPQLVAFDSIRVAQDVVNEIAREYLTSALG